jgi:hypothetical protein
MFIIATVSYCLQGKNRVVEHRGCETKICEKLKPKSSKSRSKSSISSDPQVDIKTASFPNLMTSGLIFRY